MVIQSNVSTKMEQTIMKKSVEIDKGPSEKFTKGNSHHDDLAGIGDKLKEMQSSEGKKSSGDTPASALMLPVAFLKSFKFTVIGGILGAAVLGGPVAAAAGAGWGIAAGVAGMLGGGTAGCLADFRSAIMTD
jgi:hypothetical protein